MRENKRIIHVLIVISILFLSLLTYLLYFNMFRAEEVALSSYNRRQWDEERYVKRGSIYDCEGIVLAETVVGDDNSQTRRYPKGRLYSHIIGYYSKVYGKSMLEMKYDSMLLGKGDISLSFGELKEGYDLNLTINHKLQEYAYNQMNSRSGAAVAMNPQTGEILAMVSLPDFDPTPEAIERDWNNIVEKENSPLLSRAVQGAYPPGSTYKIVTAAAAFEEGRNNEEFNDTGKFEQGSLTVDNFNSKAYGKINLKKGFAVSSNFVFCTLGYEMGAEKMKNITERFYIGKDFDFDLPMNTGTIGYKSMNSSDSALVAIGQGKLLTSPLQMAMITSCVANGGNMMKPYLVDSVTTDNGYVVKKNRPQSLALPISENCADYVKELMVETVKTGTGRNAQISGVTVAGKTGTAENETEKSHAWFVGFAPSENPKIAVAVILEYDGGEGGVHAAPIAKNIMSKYLSLK